MFEHKRDILVAHKLVVVHQVEGILIVGVGLVALVQLLERERRLAERFARIDNVAQIAQRLQRHSLFHTCVKFVILIFTVHYVWHADGQPDVENRVVGAKAAALEFAHNKLLVVGESEIHRQFGRAQAGNIHSITQFLVVHLEWHRFRRVNLLVAHLELG